MAHAELGDVHGPWHLTPAEHDRLHTQAFPPTRWGRPVLNPLGFTGLYWCNTCHVGIHNTEEDHDRR